MKLNRRFKTILAVVLPVAAATISFGTVYAARASEVQSTVTPSASTHVKQYRFTGSVTSISTTAYAVGGKTFLVTSSTQISGTIATGDTVKVGYYISGADNVATKITLVSTAPTTTSVSYSSTVQPILTASCVGCHSSGSINLTSYSGVTKSTFGTSLIVIPGNASGSVLYECVSGTGAVQKMPPNGSLTSAQQQSIADWINEGAPNN